MNKTLLRACLLGQLLLFYLLAPAAAQVAEPATELEMRQNAVNDALVGVPVSWAEETPLPGEFVKLRLRGASLSHIFSFPRQFEVTSAGQPVDARVVLPEAWQEPATVPLIITQQSGPEQPDLVLDLDRGEVPQPLNRIELSLASSKLLAKAFVAAGDTPDTMKPAGEPQLVYHQLQNGRLLRLTTLVCEPGDSRYLRVRLVKGGGAKVQSVRGWLEPEATRASYAVAAALGPMQDGLLEGEHKWPVVLKDNRVPLAKLKILADAPGQTRLMSVIRDNAGEGVNSLIQFTWADGLKLGNLSLSSKWVELSGDSINGGLTISVEDGSDPPLQLKGVQAYANEVWLVMRRPEGDDVVLWLDHAPMNEEAATDATADLPAEINVADARYGGEFNEPTLERPKAVRGHGASEGELLFSAAWFRIVTYCAAALLLLLIGVLLLRRPREAN